MNFAKHPVRNFGTRSLQLYVAFDHVNKITAANSSTLDRINRLAVQLRNIIALCKNFFLDLT